MKNSKLLCSLLFILFSRLSYAQDLIVKRDSSVIFCHIIKEDSVSIYYRQNKGEQTFELNVKKADVLNYFSKKANALAELKRADSLALVNSKKDSVKAIAYNPKPKTDSVLTKKDTLRQKVIAVIPQGDTIALNSSYKCFYKGELITRGEALKLMKSNKDAYQEMKKARGYFSPVIPLGLGAAILAGIFVGDAVSSGNFHWVVGGSSILLTAIAVTLKQTCNIHIDKSIKLFNTKPSLAGVTSSKFELSIASRGIGLCLKF